MVRPSPILVALLLWGCLLHRAFAAPGDDNWDSSFGTPSFGSGLVTHMAGSGGKLFVAGSFYRAGALACTNCAEWNGSNWLALPGYTPRYAYGVAADNSNYYILDNTGLGYDALMRWNGLAWSQLATARDAYHFAANDRGIFVTGVVTNLDGSFRGSGVFKLEGSELKLIGPPQLYGIEALFATGNELFVAYSFVTNYSGAGTVISRWDGTNWFDYPLLDPWGMFSLAVFQNELYVATTFGDIGKIVRWDGTRWVSLGGLDFYRQVRVTSMIGTPRGLYVAGIFGPTKFSTDANVARWDGTRWTFLAWDSTSPPEALAWVGGQLYAGGSFSRLGNKTCRGIARWDGTKWLPLGAGVREEGRVLAFASNGTRLVAGGEFDQIGGSATTNLATWNGTRWKPLNAPPNGPITALAATGQVIFAAGDFTRIGGITATGVACWKGTNWTALGAGTGFDIRTLAVWHGQLFAGGTTIRPGIQTVARWNGSAWRPVRNAVGSVPLNYVTELASVSRRLYAASGPSGFSGLLQWDGTNWSAVPGGPAMANHICTQGEHLWVIGDFSAGALGRWDGTNWWVFEMPDDFFTGPTLWGGMAVLDGNIYLGRYWANGMWDGLGWESLGIVGHPYTVIAHNKTVYFGGYIRAAGGKPSYSLAAWHPPAPQPELRSLGVSDGLVVAWPNSLTNYVLESTAELTSGSWTNGAQNAVVIGSHNISTNRFEQSSSRFFRLRRR
jgi:trimeric autotransporter adhesin